MADKSKKKRASKLRTEADRSKARGKKLRFEKAEFSGKDPMERTIKRKRTVSQGAAVTASGTVHSQIHRANEDENVGTKAADFGMETAEGSVNMANNARYSSKLRAHKRSTASNKAAKNAAEQAEGGANAVNAEASTTSNPLSRMQQKANIRKEYAAALRGKNAGTTAAAAANRAGDAKKAADAAKEGTSVLEKLTKYISEHPKGLLFALAFGLIIMFIMSGTSSCSSIIQGGSGMVLASSFTAEDEDIIGANDDYKALEANLQRKINNIERDNPGYDEYNYFLDEIGHDPFQLAAYLTVQYEDYTRAEVQSMLQSLFDQQYELKLEEVVETRYRTETRTSTSTDPETGETTEDEYEVEVAYDYYILNVTLTNKNLGLVITESGGMTQDQQERYAVLLQTKGNKPYLFEDESYVGGTGEYLDYDIPGEALTDARFANMIREAERYLGYPYVWGGSSPSTSFDCSGFVSYVINHCGNGWNVGRLTANGLKEHCAIIPKSEAKPGDLIFFKGTYNTSGASHVGIYVGNGMMIHCGNPISYASIEKQYWIDHFYCFGRIPN